MGCPSKIRGDKWLPCPHSRCVVSPASILSSDSMVSALIDEDSHTWDSDLIQCEFVAHEAKIIMGIPLSILNSPDMQVPHKIKHLLWKAANDAIPTLYNLWRRFKEETDMNLLAVLFWSIWEKRNSARVSGCKMSLQDMRTRAVRLLCDFANAHTTTRQQHSPVPAQWVRWIPPISPRYKVNYDGAIFKDLGAAGLGVIIRDSVGRVIGALAERIPLPSSVAMVEALACRRAVLFAMELSVFDATFEGDAEIVYKALREGDSNHPEFGLIINDSLRLASGFRFSKGERVQLIFSSPPLVAQLSAFHRLE
nr:hypothetical protein CFP56_62013 [Quercus suber]